MKMTLTVQPGVKLLVIDDLPHAAGLEQRARLAAALALLAAAARCPVVVIATASSTQGAPGDRGAAWHGLHKVRRLIFWRAIDLCTCASGDLYSVLTVKGLHKVRCGLPTSGFWLFKEAT